MAPLFGLHAAQLDGLGSSAADGLDFAGQGSSRFHAVGQWRHRRFWAMPSNVDFGWGNPDMQIVNPYIRRHINGGLELTMMMLDAFEANGDERLARDVLLPVATGVTTYFDLHWKRDAYDKLHFDSSQSLETR